MSAIEGILIPFFERLYATFGYVGVAAAMAIESACIPLPSEVILPMAGWMVSRGLFDFWLTAIAGTIGCVIGSSIAYGVGAYGGRPLLERYGRYVLINTHDIDTADNWFRKYGEGTAFFSRMLPVVRTFISLPAGVARMNFPRFILYTALGSLLWSIALVYVGRALGDHWNAVGAVLRQFDYVIVVLIVVLIALYIYRHVRTRDTAPLERH